MTVVVDRAGESEPNSEVQDEVRKPVPLAWLETELSVNQGRRLAVEDGEPPMSGEMVRVMTVGAACSSVLEQVDLEMSSLEEMSVIWLGPV